MCQLQDRGLLSDSNPSSGGEEEEEGVVQGEGEGGIWGEKRLLSSVPLVSLLETSHCTCKRQNLLVLFLPAGAQRLDRIYSKVEGMEEEASTVYIL